MAPPGRNDNVCTDYKQRILPLKIGANGVVAAKQHRDFSFFILQIVEGAAPDTDANAFIAIPRELQRVPNVIQSGTDSPISGRHIEAAPGESRGLRCYASM